MIDKSKLAFSVITHYEGFSPVAYLDAVGVRTIGYGRTTGSMAITTREKERQYVYDEIILIDGIINGTVRPYMNPMQMAALISFIYNVGSGAFRGSTLLKKINNKDTRAADEFLRWCKGGTNVLPGLVKRRMTEYLMFKNKEVVLL